MAANPTDPLDPLAGSVLDLIESGKLDVSDRAVILAAFRELNRKYWYLDGKCYRLEGQAYRVGFWLAVGFVVVLFLIHGS